MSRDRALKMAYFDQKIYLEKIREIFDFSKSTDSYE